MILQVIRGQADRESVRALQAELAARLAAGGPDAAYLPDRHHLGVRPAARRDDVLVLACWPSAEAPAAADRRGTSPLGLARQHLERVEVVHFEVDQNVLREPDARPTALRIATGRFSRPGGDIHMQELLRQRLSSIGPEMSEAYVARRITGRAVDVTFVSIWRDRPADKSLEEPFWTDITVHYDDFTVEVFGPVD